MGARQSRLLLDDIDTIAYNESHYAEIVRANCTEFKVTISISEYIICDCRLYWFARMLAECPRHVRWAAAPACDRRPMLEQPLDHMLCPIQGEEVCAGGCECWWRDAEHSRVVANCSARGLHRLPPLPQLPPLLQLHAARNHIQAIHSHDIPDTLTYIDLRNNNISRVGAAETRRLFSVRGRRVRLAGNPLRCHCDNRPLVRALLTHRHQVDYADLKCDDEKLLSTIIVEDLCALSPTETLVYALSPTVTAFLLVVLAIWFMYYYRMEVRVYLYSRGLCQCCVREEDLDGDREFDAFVSYTHLDEQFVYEQLVPELESGSPSFKLCIHTRDWVVGEWVPAQIIHSVDNSRRTIIVMSRNFLSSVWGLMEFRTAHMTAMREGRARIIVILLEELGEHPQLDEELKAYLTTNTYLKWGDPRFFDKLRYALPHRRGERDRRQAAEEVASEFPMVQLQQLPAPVRLALPAP